MKKIFFIIFSFLLIQNAVCGLAADFYLFITDRDNTDFVNLEIYRRCPNLVSDMQACLAVVDERERETDRSTLKDLFICIDELKELCYDHRATEIFSLEFGGYALVYTPFTAASQRMLNFIENKMIPKIYAVAEIN